MAHCCIGKSFLKKVCRKSIEKASLGHLFERCALVYCRKSGYRIISRNLRMKIGEIDLLAYDRTTNSLVIIEVRGRTKVDSFLPSRCLSNKKIERLKKIATIISTKWKMAVRIELLEMFFKCKYYLQPLTWLVGIMPKFFGVKWNVYKI